MSNDAAPQLDSGSTPIVGVLGGIGSGKSEVSKLLTRVGGRRIDADALGHEALRQPDIRAKIVARWGEQLLGSDGEIVRRALGSIVFGDPEEMKHLEAWVHPHIERRIREEASRAANQEGVAFLILDAAIMLEAGWDRVCDRLIFVDTPREVRLARLAASRGWTEEELASRERAQLPLTEKASRADHVVDNSGTLSELEEQVERLVRSWGSMTDPEPA